MKAYATAFDQTRLYFEDEGAGLALLFVHAGITDSRMWERQFSEFARSHRVIRYDMRGYGKSDVPDKPFSHYQDILAVLDVCEVEEAVLIGCSLGGMVSIEAAVAYPHRIRGLVVSGGLARGLDYEIEPDDPPQMEALFEALKRGDHDLVNELEAQIWVDGYGQPPGRAPEELRDFIKEMNRTALKNDPLKQEALERPLEPMAGLRLAGLTIPVLMINGSLDEPFTIAAAEQMKASYTRIRQAIIEGTAHFPNLEKPEEFNALIWAYLKTLAT